MTDGSGTHTYTYKASGALDLDSCTSGILSGVNVDPAYNAYGQRSSLTATQSGTTIGSTVYYGWDSGARPYTIGAASFSSSGALAYFSYHNKSDLPSATTFYNTYPLTLMTTSRTFDGFNRLQSVSNKIGYSSNVINSHVYSYDAAGGRSTATVETGDVWNWGYNSRGEVTDAKKDWSGGGYLRGRTFTYGYDNIGNRTTHSSGGTTAGGTTRTTGYTINPDGTNEIQSIANPSAFDVTGLASGTVTVGDNPLDTALMQGGFFHSERNETAEAGKVQPGLRHVVVTAGGNALHGDVYVPEATETTTCDGSGNLTSDSRWTYTWTEDNRLREIATRSTSGIANASASCVRAAFDYYYFGRRVQKRTYINYNWNTPSSGTLSKTVKYVWDGWNCIAELNGVDSKFFIWGPDLSGGDGAGGVGGLLFVQDLSGTYALETNHCLAYDGNGNVTAIVDGMYGTGAVEAAYEYDPFGNAIRQSGPYALTNPFRFSTKFTDDESGLIYYGFRYYDPVRGRWPSRDPIEENGGINLYSILGNDCLNSWDFLGLAGPQDHHWIPQEGGRNDAIFRKKCNDLDLDNLTSSLWTGNGRKTAAHNVIHTRFNYNKHVNSLLNDPELDCCAFLQAVKEIIQMTQKLLALGEHLNKVDRGGAFGVDMPRTRHSRTKADTTGLIDKWIEEKCRCPGGFKPIDPKAAAAVSKYEAEALSSLGVYPPIDGPQVGPSPWSPEESAKLSEEVAKHRRMYEDSDDTSPVPMIVPTPAGPEVRPVPRLPTTAPGRGRGRGTPPPRSPWRNPARVAR